MSDCLCDVRKGVTCSMHALRATMDMGDVAEWYAMAESEAPERFAAEGSHYCRVRPEVAASIQAVAGDGDILGVTWEPDGDVLIEYAPIGDLTAEVRHVLVPSGLMATDAMMRDVLRDDSHWTRYDWRDSACGKHGEPLPKCPVCKVERKQASNERLVKARAALKAKREAAKAAKAAPVVSERERISTEVRERIGVLPLD